MVNYFNSKNFILTLNAKSLEYYQDVILYLKSLKGLVYLLVCEHLGQDNQHYHIFVQYENTKKLSIRRLHGAHLEKCYGSAQQNIRYCKAEDDKHVLAGVRAEVILEEGEPKLKGGNFTVGFLQEVDDPCEIPANLYNVYKRIKKDSTLVRAKDFRKNVKVYWIQGPSGVGKTNKAIELAGDYELQLETGTDFIKYVNGFYLGTTNRARVAIYDDFRDSHMKPDEFINLIDYNKHWMNIKGDSILNEYLIIIITSVQKFNKIYRNVADEPRAQWERRVEVINMYPPESVCVGGLPVGYKSDFNQFENYDINDIIGRM